MQPGAPAASSTNESTMPEKKQHHYVPKMHLRRFSADGASIRLCNLKSGHIAHKAPIKGQCYRDYMYGKTPEREDALATIEGIAKKVLDIVIREGRLPAAKSPSWSTILMFTALQYGRTAYTADAMDDIVNKISRHMGGHNPQLGEFFDKGGRVGLKDVASLGVQNALETYLLLSDLRMVLIRAAPGVEFITSDAPAVFYNQAFEDLLQGSSTGWAWKGLQCFLPINPDYTLLLFDSSVYRVKSGDVRLATAQDTLNLNVLQCVAAYENVYFLGQTKEEVLGWRARASRLRRKEKVQLKVQKEALTESHLEKHLLMTSKTDIKIGLKLSFMNISKAGTSWINSFMNLRHRPVVAVRNEWLLGNFRRFDQAVKAGEYQKGEFLKFMAAQP